MVALGGGGCRGHVRGVGGVTSAGVSSSAQGGSELVLVMVLVLIVELALVVVLVFIMELVLVRELDLVVVLVLALVVGLARLCGTPELSEKEVSSSCPTRLLSCPFPCPCPVPVPFPPWCRGLAAPVEPGRDRNRGRLWVRLCKSSALLSSASSLFICCSFQDAA